MSGPRRFGNGVTSLPLGIRLAVTVPVVVLEVLMLRALVANAQLDDSRPAAFNLFAIGVVAAVAAPFVRQMWRSTDEWNRARSHEAFEARDTADQLRERRGLEYFVGLESCDADAGSDSDAPAT